MVEKSPLKSPKFLLTREVGKLARWLRILGFDARYEPAIPKSSVMIEALKEGRIVVTRNLRFGTRHGGTVVFIKANEWADQLSELKRALLLPFEPQKIFSRCVLCNDVLEDVAKARIENKVPLYVAQTQNEFKQCPRCHRIYWKGTHGGHVEEVLKKLASSTS